MKTSNMKAYQTWIEAPGRNMHISPESFEYAQSHMSDMNVSEMAGYREWIAQFQAMFAPRSTDTED